MAFNKNFYPQFSDIRIYNVPGRDPATIQQMIVDFITDPAHSSYRWIDFCVNYLSWASDGRQTHPGDLWTSVAIIYTADDD